MVTSLVCVSVYGKMVFYLIKGTQVSYLGRGLCRCNFISHPATSLWDSLGKGMSSMTLAGLCCHLQRAGGSQDS